MNPFGVDNLEWTVRHAPEPILSAVQISRATAPVGTKWNETFGWKHHVNRVAGGWTEMHLLIYLLKFGWNCKGPPTARSQNQCHHSPRSTAWTAGPLNQLAGEAHQHLEDRPVREALQKAKLLFYKSKRRQPVSTTQLLKLVQVQCLWNRREIVPLDFPNCSWATQLLTSAMPWCRILLSLVCNSNIKKKQKLYRKQIYFLSKPHRGEPVQRSVTESKAMCFKWRCYFYNTMFFLVKNCLNKTLHIVFYIYKAYFFICKAKRYINRKWFSFFKQQHAT